MRKFFRLWFNLGYDDGALSRASAVLALFHLLAWGLALVGVRLGRPDPVARRFMTLLAVFWTLIYVPFVAVVRYSLPYYALLFVFTAAGTLVLATWAGIRIPRRVRDGATRTGSP